MRKRLSLAARRIITCSGFGRGASPHEARSSNQQRMLRHMYAAPTLRLQRNASLSAEASLLISRSAKRREPRREVCEPGERWHKKCGD
jgi:hypothetical protein